MDSQHKTTDKPDRREKSPRSGSFNAQRSIVVGLTGGIATGKTTVGQMLSKLGAITISADEVVHRLMANQTDLQKAIVAEFGEVVLSPDGSIDRRRLGDIVFKDSRKRKRLEEIIHPQVIEFLSREADRFRREETGILVLEIPLLIETSTTKIVDKVLVVKAEQESQIQRLNNRYSITREQALLRINSQLPMSEKIKYADWVINTDGTMQDTREQVQKVWSALQKSLAQQ